MLSVWLQNTDKLEAPLAKEKLAMKSWTSQLTFSWLFGGSACVDLYKRVRNYLNIIERTVRVRVHSGFGYNITEKAHGEIISLVKLTKQQRVNESNVFKQSSFSGRYIGFACLSLIPRSSIVPTEKKTFVHLKELLLGGLYLEKMCPRTLLQECERMKTHANFLSKMKEFAKLCSLSRGPNNVLFICGGQSQYPDIRGPDRLLFCGKTSVDCSTLMCCTNGRCHGYELADSLTPGI